MKIIRKNYLLFLLIHINYTYEHKIVLEYNNKLIFKIFQIVID